MEIELISDGAGLAVIGDPAAVELFLASEGMPSKDLDLPRLDRLLGTGGAATQAGAEFAANSGRWVKLTEESAQAMKKYKLMKGTSPGVSRAVLTEGGKSKGFLQIVRTPGSSLANPALLSGVGGMMAQLAMQQAMEEITDYLATIGEKLDDVLRSQTNQVLARMDGVDLAIREAMKVRETVGRVSEVTWSKVQATSTTILDTQAYALRQLGDLADKLERKTKVGDLAKATKDAQSEVQKWLAVLARCFQLQDAVAVLELDRVLDASPEELDRHRLGLAAARHDRMTLISECTGRLISRMDSAAGAANLKVLLHPSKAPALVEASNAVSGSILEFHGRIGIEGGRDAPEARRWKSAAAAVRDKAIERGAERVDSAKRVSGQTFDRARSTTEEFSRRVAEQARRRRHRDADSPDGGS
jgi:O-acetyl-ADP-ribose deacetylase (regulator of RNase III)